MAVWHIIGDSIVKGTNYFAFLYYRMIRSNVASLLLTPVFLSVATIRILCYPISLGSHLP
jgi:hypothetical protein